MDLAVEEAQAEGAVALEEALVVVDLVAAAAVEEALAEGAVVDRVAAVAVVVLQLLMVAVSLSKTILGTVSMSIEC